MVPAPGVVWSVPRLTSPVSVYVTGCGSKVDPQLLSQGGGTDNCLGRSDPEIHQRVVGTLSNEPVNKLSTTLLPGAIHIAPVPPPLPLYRYLERDHHIKTIVVFMRAAPAPQPKEGREGLLRQEST